MSNLKTIESAIRRLEAMYECNHEVMDADDCGDLLTTIKDLEEMKRQVIHEEYKEKVTAFRDHVLSTMPTVECETQKDVEVWDEFYGLKWFISFGGVGITLDNGADTWQPIVDMLNGHLDEL